MYQYITEIEGLNKALDSISKLVSVIGNKVLAIDTETTGLDPFISKVLLIQIVVNKREFIFDCRKLDSHIKALTSLLEDKLYVKILQNAKFDIKMLKYHYGIELNNIFDTMIAERLLTVGKSNDIHLKDIAFKYLDERLDKEIRMSFVGMKGEFTDEQLEYAINDVRVLEPIYELQKKELKREKLNKIAKMEFELTRVMADIELNGVLIDIDKWKKVIDKAEINRDVTEVLIQDELGGESKQLSLFGDMVDYDLNVNSPLQLKKALNKIGIKVNSTGSKVLANYKQPIIKKILEYRTHSKFCNMYGSKFLNLISEVTGRIHCDFRQIGSDSGRINANHPNIQQIPAKEEYRSCFIAKKGYKLITADYSQAELRILGELSNDEAFLEAFQNDEDLHRRTASQMFHIDVDKVTKEQRNIAKAINFGLSYGMGVDGLARTLEIDRAEAGKLISSYLELYAGVKEWSDNIVKETLKKGYSVTIGGRKRWFNIPEVKDKSWHKIRASIGRQAKNSPIQGTSADITKYALVYLYEALEGYNAKIINTIHDEIVVEVVNKEVDEVKKIIVKEMIRAGALLVKKIVMKVDINVADYWYH